MFIENIVHTVDYTERNTFRRIYILRVGNPYPDKTRKTHILFLYFIVSGLRVIPFLQQIYDTGQS